MFFFFFNDTATTEIYTLSLHDALPISPAATAKAAPEVGVVTLQKQSQQLDATLPGRTRASLTAEVRPQVSRSEEHTSELQSLTNLVCRLLLEKKKIKSTWYGGMCRLLS